MEKSLQDKLNDYYHLAQYHMKLAHIMRNHHQFETALFLCHSALISMIRALYIYENKVESDSEISLIDLLLLIHTDYYPGLDIVVFIGELNYIVSEGDKGLEVVKVEDGDRLIVKTEEILGKLSKRMKKHC
ncbi:HEPN domain-containing protein [Paenibacillus durus]|nr:HEPN domain-containing protein [Paenibacillus durus]